MKAIISFFILSFAFLHSFSQEWTTAQLDSANTAKDISDISDVEKEAIQYINLARMFPQLFLANELKDYTGPSRYGDFLKNSSYKKSLINELKTRKPIPALQFDKSLYDLAKCFSKELGDAGTVTHKRKRCPYGYMGECCSFGMDTGKDIAMQWLIDDKVAGMGHRINCFNSEYTIIGISAHSHKAYANCAVADFR
jgi:uncharacterized protein YkwD